MKTIWKFNLVVTDRQRIEMPKGAQVLTVQLQDGWPRLWALVELDEASLTEMRTFEIHGTGNPIDDGERHYIATFQQPPFVWHVFERLGVQS